MKKILIIAGIILLVLPSLAFVPGELNYGGTFIKQDDGTYWYLHSKTEFLGDCLSCHPEMSNTFWSCESGILYISRDRVDL